MKLAIRTSSGAYGVGLLDSEGSLVGAQYGDDRAFRSANVGDLLSELLEETGHAQTDIGEILVDLGPGGLSATRVGVSFANAFAFGGAAKLFGVSALQLQMDDARRVTELPLLSIRPAPGGLSFWAVYEGTSRVVEGCEPPSEAIARLVRRFDRLAVAGPIERLGLGKEGPGGAEFIEVDPPSLESFFKAERRLPRLESAIALLEPIVSLEGLRHD